MSSVIVLDSSDEDEVPAKRAFIAPSIPATITPIKGTTAKCSANMAANQLKHKKTKPRPIPSGITITRRSPVDITSSNTTNSNALGRITVSNMNETAAKISAETVAATSKLILSKTSTASLLKINASTNMASLKERQTPTPPRHLSQQLNLKQQQQRSHVANKQQQQQQQQKHLSQQQSQQGVQLPLLSQLPQLQPSPSVLRKRLSTASSPPQQLQMPPQQQPQPPKLQKSKQQHNPPKLQQQQQQQQLQKQQQQQQQTLKLDSQVRKLSTPPAMMSPSSISTTSTSNTTLLPLISSVQSMAAGATPPLQLLATPPHSAATTFSDHQLFSPKLMHTTCSLPPSTTVTAARTQLSSSINTNINNNTNSNMSSNTSNNNKNINNNFKIMLPPKTTNNNVVSVNLSTASITSASVASSLATPVALQQSSSGPRIAYVNSLATQMTPTINRTNSNNLINYAHKTKTSTAPIVPIAITPASSLTVPGMITTSASITTTSSSINVLAGPRRVKPTTLLRKNDEAWLKRASTPTTTAKSFNDDDLVLELLPHATNTKTQHPISSMTVEPVKNAAQTQVLKTSKAPEIAVKSSFHKSTFPMKIDLTESPEKTNNPHGNETITNSSTISPSQTKSMKNKSNSSIANGDAKIQPAKCTTLVSNDKIGKSIEEQLPLTGDYEELLKVCREADTSADMEKLIKTKLIRYYYNVHPDFVRSKGFGKNLRTVITNIQKQPDLVYLHLRIIVDELKVRSKNKDILLSVLIKDEEKIDSPSGEKDKDKDKDKDTPVGGDDNGLGDDISSTGNKHTDDQIKKLNKALYILTKRIEVLDSAEVDWDDEDSSYLQVERFKKRACQIYEKICDLTGESKNAHRLVKKPIHFNGTTYTQFNKTLQAYINRTKEFPDYFDVLRMLEHCNRQYDYALANFEMKRIAHDAFIKVGKLLQSRRKTDLYETVTHFTAHEKDPATSDATLQAKLSENQKKRTRISDVIEKYAREQDMIKEELKEARQAKVAKSNDDNEEDDAIASTSANAAKIAALRRSKHKTESDDILSSNDRRNDNDDTLDTDEDDDDDEDEDEEDDEEQVNGSDLEADVEKLANGILSDVESDIEIVINSSIKKAKENMECDVEEFEAPINVNHKTLDILPTESSASTKTKTVAKTDFVAMNTQKAITITKTDKQSTAPMQTSYTVNNNLMRQKTAYPLANDPQKTSIKTNMTTEIDGRQTIAIANGRTNTGVTQSNINNPTGIAQAATIKIVSVSSLKNVNIVDSENTSIDRKPTNRNTTQTKMQTPNALVREIKRQRTVAEIVISDEES